MRIQARMLTGHVTPADIRRARSSRAWRILSKATINRWPICHLRLPGCTLRSTTADHLIPATLRPDLFFDPGNLRGACKPCNDLRRDVPMDALEPLRDPKYDPRRKQAEPYARRRIGSHRRPSQAAATYFGKEPPA